MKRCLLFIEASAVPTDTDLRLRSVLDGNQRDREQMCRAVLALDPHYSDVRPRHPLGGPDGGRDIEAILDTARIAYGAVGFHNGANDSAEQKKQIRKKFSADLRSALRAGAELKAFVFFTNLHFTVGEQDKMKEKARQAGLDQCEIYDRERIRIELDSPAGFFIRFQYLGIPLSEAEQASFLARYGDRIQEVVSTGFQRIERTLSRLLFLQESSDVLDGINVRFHLNRTHAAGEIGHFRAFVSLHLRAVKHDILSFWFGSSDRSRRFSHDSDDWRQQPAGIEHGISSGQWERHVACADGHSGGKESGAAEKDDRDDKHSDFVCVGGGSAVGINPVSDIVTSYSHDDPLIRFRPRLQLRDLDECMFMPVLNLSLAKKLHSIEVFANGYKLADIGSDEFSIDSSPFESELIDLFTEEELADPWVRIRPRGASAFRLQFGSMTPRRMYDHSEAPERRKV
jgi:hypothetical protein